MKRSSSNNEDEDLSSKNKVEEGTPEYNSSTHLGKFVIKAVEAKLLIDTEVFGKMDPFLEV
jgi:hypothetical protein